MVNIILSTCASYIQAEIHQGLLLSTLWLLWRVFAVVLALTPSILGTSLYCMVFISVPLNVSQISQILKNCLFVHNVGILVIVLSVISLIWLILQGTAWFLYSFTVSWTTCFMWRWYHCMIGEKGSYALFGPSSEVLNGHCARFICNYEIYMDDNFFGCQIRPHLQHICAGQYKC